MDILEAELIYEAGKEAVVKALLETDARTQALEQQILALQKMIASLSTNSSKPPSSDGPKVVKPKKKKSSRSPRGREGHKGHKREPRPVEEMDDVHDHYPRACGKCGGPMAPENCPETSDPTRYQTFELPEIKPIMEEHRCHELGCACGHRTRAELPPEVAQSQFGPRVHGGIAYLTSHHSIGGRGMVEILNTLYSLDLCLGSVCNCIERVSPELEPAVEEVRQTLPECNNLNVDETGWKCKGDRRYLWVIVSPLVIRKLKALRDGRASPDTYIFSKSMLNEVGRIFSCWHAFREGYITREQLLDATTLMRARMKRYCPKYLTSTDEEVCTRAKRLLDNWDHLFTFLTREGVEPTNNAGERAFRFAVQWRKLCFGNQSEAGERFTERILTVTRTCQL